MRIDVFAKIEGGEQLRARMRQLEPQFKEAIKVHLASEGAELLGRAQALAPAKSGELKASALVTSHEARGKVSTVVAYTAEQSAAVHEGVHWGRKVTGTRGFKWFERAANAFVQGAIERAAAVLRRVAGGQ